MGVERIKGQATMSEKLGDKYRITVEFEDEVEAFKSRQMEQIIRAEKYWKDQQHIGRKISFNEAFAEWIRDNGSQFPR